MILHVIFYGVFPPNFGYSNLYRMGSHLVGYKLFFVGPYYVDCLKYMIYTLTGT